MFFFLRHNFFILSHSEVFVKNFFYFAVSFFRKQLVHFIILFQECQVLFCDTTSLFYHIQKSLSRTFLIYFLMFCCFSRATRTFYHIPIHLSSTFLFFFFIFQIRVKNITEKEGFEPSHRAKDLHP